VLALVAGELDDRLTEDGIGAGAPRGVESRCRPRRGAAIRGVPLVWKPMIATTCVAMLTAVLGAASTRAVPSAGTPQDDGERLARGQALTASRCTGCHGFSTVATAGRSAEAWQATVDGMIRLGAEMSADEARAIVAYLAATFPARP
jgi:mono/diheme cytochrome c family protein